MKAICEGRKTRQEVVSETIAQYLAVYNRTQQRLNVLHTVSLRCRDGDPLQLTSPQSVRKYVLGEQG